jgi:UDP-N-acetylmuramyl pentapeptide phosphotransferase/UDP-N-acetylglucosamine-1-phosphate transferase
VREYMLTLLTAAAVTYLLTPLARRVSQKFGAMHDPRDRDMHKVPTPLLGGLAMYGGLVVALLLAGRFGYLSQALGNSRTASGILLAGGLLVAVGVFDDRWGMSAISKLAAQVAAGGILVWSGTELSWIPSPYGNVIVLSPNQGLVLTILLVAMTINAVNFIDGMDGLAAGIVAISALAYFSYSYTLLKVTDSATQSLPALVSAILAGMCLGFLPYNFYPARIFMGDTGAMLLGLLLAYGPIASTATLDPNLLVAYGRWAARRRQVPDDPATAAARRHLPHPVCRPAAGCSPAHQGGAVTVHRGHEAPAPPAAELRALAAQECADHVPVGRPVRRLGGGTVHHADQADDPGGRHAGRHADVAAGHGAEAAATPAGSPPSAGRGRRRPGAHLPGAAAIHPSWIFSAALRPAVIPAARQVPLTSDRRRFARSGAYFSGEAPR